MTSAKQKAERELAAMKAQMSGVGRRILAIDPGTACTGATLLVDGVPEKLLALRSKGLVAEARLPDMCLQVRRLIEREKFDTLAIEWQAIRPGDPRPNDIANLMVVLGAALSVDVSSVQLLRPLPVQWKGSGNPEIFDRRVRAHCPDAAVLMHDIPHSLQHNVVDSLGLAFWAINRRLPWA